MNIIVRRRNWPNNCLAFTWIFANPLLTFFFLRRSTLRVCLHLISASCVAVHKLKVASEIKADWLIALLSEIDKLISQSQISTKKNKKKSDLSNFIVALFFDLCVIGTMCCYLVHWSRFVVVVFFLRQRDLIKSLLLSPRLLVMKFISFIYIVCGIIRVLWKCHKFAFFFFFFMMEVLTSIVCGFNFMLHWFLFSSIWSNLCTKQWITSDHRILITNVFTRWIMHFLSCEFQQISNQISHTLNVCKKSNKFHYQITCNVWWTN